MSWQGDWSRGSQENIRRQRSEQMSVTEHPPDKKDPDIRLQKYSNPSHVRTKTYNNRKPDIGLGILISMPSHEADDIIEYYGEYLGHGRSKTAFVLHCPGAEFHGKVLKVAKTFDMEPSVFTKASKHNLTTTILYNCHGAFFALNTFCFSKKFPLTLQALTLIHSPLRIVLCICTS